MRPADFQPRPITRRDWQVAAVLAAIAFAVFAPSIWHGFSTFDDPYYVFQNARVVGGLNQTDIIWAFTTFDNSNWHPLTWLSLQLDASVWGLMPGGFHATNVLLHAVNAALLFFVLRGLTGAVWRSAAVALLFAVHPLRVESVAWITERKDVLSVCFGLLALWAWIRYVSAPALGRYLIVAGALALGLLSKPMLVTFPCLLLVLDWWPLRRVNASMRAPAPEAEPPIAGEDVAASPARKTSNLRTWLWLTAEKLPLLVLAALVAYITFLAQEHQGAMQDLTKMPLAARLNNAAVSYVDYLAKTIWPVGLALLYPHQGAELPLWKGIGAAALLVAITITVVALRRRAPYLLAGWLWYLGTLVPVIGLVQVGTQALADRYTYFPQIGILLAICWGIADLAAGRARAALGLAGATAVVLAGLTLVQLQLWADPVALWQHSLRATGESCHGLLSLARALEARGGEGDLAAAIAYYRAALDIDPESSLGHANLGGILARTGNASEVEEAIGHLQKACEAAPYYAPAFDNLGYAYYRQGKLDQAAEELKEATRLAPDLAVAHHDLGLVEAAKGDLDGAIECYWEALRVWPAYADAHRDLAATMLRKGGISNEVVDHAREALRLNPRSAETQLLSGKLLDAMGDPGRAVMYFDAATHLDPMMADAWHSLGLAHARLDHPEQAEECMAQAVKLQPSTAVYAADLARVLDAKAATLARDQQQWDEAVAMARRAAELAKTAKQPDLEKMIREQLQHYERHEAGDLSRQ
jgi:tetratricopeptide (TPR) repeat protein